MVTKKMTNYLGDIHEKIGVGIVYGCIGIGSLMGLGCGNTPRVREPIAFPQQPIHPVVDSYEFPGTNKPYNLFWGDGAEGERNKTKVQLGVVLKGLVDGDRSEAGDFVNVESREGYFDKIHPMVKWGSPNRSPLEVTTNEADNFLRVNFERWKDEIVPDWYKNSVRNMNRGHVDSEDVAPYSPPVAPVASLPR